jgi:hypothetical protein
MVTLDEQRALQLRNAEADEQFWSSLHGMHAGTVEDHKALLADAERKIAQGHAEMATAAGHRDAAKERCERLERGEDVQGGLGKPFTREDFERILLKAGCTKADLRHFEVVGAIAGVRHVHPG